MSSQTVCSLCTEKYIPKAFRDIEGIGIYRAEPVSTNDPPQIFVGRGLGFDTEDHDLERVLYPEYSVKKNSWQIKIQKARKVNQKPNFNYIQSEYFCFSEGCEKFPKFGHEVKHILGLRPCPKVITIIRHHSKIEIIHVIHKAECIIFGYHINFEKEGCKEYVDVPGVVSGKSYFFLPGVYM